MKSQAIFLYALKLIAITLLYFLIGIFGLSFSPIHGFASLVWPATGFAFAMLFIFGINLWPAILLGAFFVNFNTGAPFLVAVGIAIGNALEAFAGAYLFRKVEAKFKNIDGLQSVFLLIGITFLCTFISALVGTTSLYFGNIASLASLRITFQSWWIGDILGNIIIGYFLVIWLRQTKFTIQKIPPYLVLRLFFLFLLILTIGFTVFGNVLNLNIKPHAPIGYFMLIPILYAALRLNMRFASLTGLLISVIAIWGAINQQGPFIQGSINETLFFTQLFIFAISMTGIIIASTETTKRRLEKQIQEDMQETIIRKNNFIRMMSHELRNPLSPIVNGVQFLLSYIEKKSSEGKPTDPVIKKQISIIEKHGKNIASLLDDLLKTSKLDEKQTNVETKPSHREDH